jgi:hypothetical protein
MKSRIILTLTLLLSLSMVFTSCKKDKDDPGNDNTLGTIVDVGGNIFFRCKIDGTDFEATQLQVFQTNGQGTATSLWQYHVYAPGPNGSYFQIALQNLKFEKVTAQAYDMEVQTQDFTISAIYFDGTKNWSAAGGAQIPGEWKISTISGNSTTGTFNFTGSASGDQKVVTAGSYGTNKYDGDV